MNEIKFSEWQLKLKPQCPDLTPETRQFERVKYICKCGTIGESTPKLMLRKFVDELRCQPCAMKKLWKDPEYKEQRVESIKEQFIKPEYIEKHKQNNINKWKNDEFRKIFSSKEINQKKSETMIEKWQDEAYKTKIKESYTDERREKISIQMRSTVGKEMVEKMTQASVEAKKITTARNRERYAVERINPDFEVLEIGFKYKVQCKRCSTIYYRTAIRLSRSCIHCDSPKYTQNAIAELLQEFDPKTIWLQKGTLRREIDIALNNGYAIEYCGLHWHNEESKDKHYHYQKMKLAEENNYKLITIFEDEWLQRKNQIANYLLNKFSNNTVRIMGRKCEVIVVDPEESLEFFNEYHIQKSAYNVIITIGLVHGDELVSCISIGEHHRINGEFVLSRLCSKPNISVIGGLSKMLKKLKEEIPNISKLKTWSDNRWSTGGVYQSAGFELVKELAPDYSYCLRQKRYSKQSLRLKKGETGPESALRKSQGYKRIWDCGKKTWVYTFKSEGSFLPS